MRIGWVDYSKDDREKSLEILNSIYEQGTLDELGIAPIRDFFSETFFPGITTIQTRAKYFFLIPYSLIDINNENNYNYDEAIEKFHRIENRSCNR